MKRQPEHEQLNRLTAKSLDQVFNMRAKEGLGSPQFEAEALTGLIKDVYFPWLSRPEVIQAGQLAMIVSSTDGGWADMFLLRPLTALHPIMKTPAPTLTAGGCFNPTVFTSSVFLLPWPTLSALLLPSHTLYCNSIRMSSPRPGCNPNAN